MNPHLPDIQERDTYNSLFKKDELWLPAIQWIRQRHHLHGEPLRSPFGSHIVYRVGDTWIKLMAPVFQAEMIFELSGLRSVIGRLSVETPRILFEGQIDHWKYVGLSHVQGEALRTAWSKLNTEQKNFLIPQLAKVLHEVSHCQAEDVVQNRFPWNEFISFQYINMFDTQAKKDLPKPWLEKVQSFINGFDLKSFQISKPVFLHSDLTFEHFLVSVEKHPKVQGIIDLADCQAGHPEYELAAPVVFLLKGQKDLLRKFLLEWGFLPDQLNQSLSERLLAWVLLHRYCAIKTHFKAEMDQCQPGDFKTLAGKVFPL